MTGSVTEGPAATTQHHAGVQFGPFGLKLLAVCKVVAILGGLVFVGLVIMSIVSIVGRKIASAPLPGDVELLQLCSAFAAASFFAYCHLVGGDVKVDFFTQHLRTSIVQALDAIGSLLVGLFGALIAWRSFAGAITVKDAGETTMILSLPLWAGQMLMVPGFVLLAVAGLYMAWQHLRAAGSDAKGNRPFDRTSAEPVETDRVRN
jgi:TRAP-type C4-dicarboxylate transport system permease small subunit